MATRKFKLMFVVCIIFLLNSAELVWKTKGQGYLLALAGAECVCKDMTSWNICTAP